MRVRQTRLKALAFFAAFAQSQKKVIFNLRGRQTNRFNRPASLTKKSGQVVVEYVLLLLIIVALAASLIRIVAKRDPSEPGFVIEFWDRMNQTISGDSTDQAQ